MPNNHLDFGVDLLPATTETYDLGNSDKKWNNIYGKTIYSNGTQVSVSGHTHNYAASSSAGGSATYAATTADTTNALYPIGVTSSATTTLKRDTSITMTGGALSATKYLATHTAGGGKEFEVSYSTTIDMAFMVGSGNENHGIYDYKKGSSGAWILSAGADNNWTLNASVALTNITGADDLKAIEALSGTSGFLKKTAANTWTLDTNSYSTTSHNHSGTYVPNTSGANDVNTIVNTGIYNITSGSATNTPKGYGYANLLVLCYRKHTGNTTTDWASQIYLHNGGNSESGSATAPGNVLYYRTSNSSSWFGWRKAIHAPAAYTAIGNSATPVYIDQSGAAVACTDCQAIEIIRL